MPARPSQGR